MARAKTGFPVARSEGLVSEESGRELLIYDTASDQAHRLNPLAAAVFAGCDGETSPAELASLASGRLGEPVSVELVTAALAELERLQLASAPTDGGLSRRRLISKAALGAAAVPLIVSITAPTPANAQSACTGFCLSNGDCNPGCGCLSGLCQPV